MSVVSFVFAGWQTAMAYRNLQAGQFTHSTEAAHRAELVVGFWNSLTAQKIPDLAFWDQGLQVFTSVNTLAQNIPSYLVQAFNAQPAPQDQLSVITTHFNQLTTQLTSLDQKLPTTVIAQRVISPTKRALLHQAALNVTDFNQIVALLTQGEHTYLVVFQNSDELRATGGFMGSYQRLKLKNGQVEDMTIEDIYQPAGQVHSDQAPPPGVKEYLSSGNNWGLTDTNWNPDLPTAAPTILNFFIQGKEPAEGLVLCNLSLAQQLLQITGEVYLPDQGVTVTAENLSTLARADRSQFFPGSRQKQHFLSAVFNQLKLKLTHLNSTQQLQLLETLVKAVQTKDIQVYSSNPTLENIAQKFDVAGAINITPKLLFPFESNVGINKANALVTRTYSLAAGKNMSQFQIVFTNKNLSQPDPEHPQSNAGNYINYQRVWLPTNVNVDAITLDQKSLLQWDLNQITLASGQVVQEVGFLVPVLAQNQSTVTLTLSHPDYLYAAGAQIPRQSGVPPVTLQLH
jgi:hypothetical protein